MHFTPSLYEENAVYALTIAIGTVRLDAAWNWKCPYFWSRQDIVLHEDYDHGENDFVASTKRLFIYGLRRPLLLGWRFWPTTALSQVFSLWNLALEKLEGFFPLNYEILSFEKCLNYYIPGSQRGEIF